MTTYLTHVLFNQQPVPVKQVFGHASGPISTARLYVSPHLHLPPIHVVVSNGPLYRNTHLGAGFALRCFQRLS